MKFSIDEAETDTLRMTLDFACGKLRARLGATMMDAWDHLAVAIAEDKVRLLRDKLFPPTEN